MTSGKTKTVLSDVLFLYSARTEDPLAITYELECTTIANVVFTLDFSGSENFRVVKIEQGREINLPIEELKVTTNVTPFSRATLCRVEMVDDEKRASLRLGCSWTMQDPDDSELHKYTQQREMVIRRELQDAAKLNIPREMDDPTHSKVIQELLPVGKYFIDTDFPPIETSLYGSKRESKGDQSSAAEQKAVEWRRPHEFFKGKYTLFHEGIAADDIRQGALGDCWFLCSIAALTEFPVMIEALFPPETREGHKVGVYTVRFCKNGLWTSVRVDDYFPCYPGAGPIYSRANGEELWVLLIEKAYAKLHGSYGAIRAGWSYEGMMDLTGAPCINIRFDDAIIQSKIASGELWTTIMRYDLENYIMSASTPGEDEFSDSGRRPKTVGTGLIGGHAYTLISAKASSRGDRLVKLRNPWGSTEWTGDWSDTSPLWTAEMQAEIEPLSQADDGTFWMSFDDLIKHFCGLNVCMTRFPGLNKRPWKEARRSFFFDYTVVEDENAVPPADPIGEASGANAVENYRIMSPSYLLNLQERGTVIVSVHQEDTRCAGAKPYIDIGVTILKTDPVHGTFQLVTGTGNSTERQHQTEELELEAGRYIIVPTTSGCKLKQYLDEQRANGSLSSAQDSLPKVALTRTERGKRVFTEPVIKAYTELFRRMDSDCDGKLSKAEMDQYLLRTEGATMEDQAFQFLLHLSEHNEKDGITLPGFLFAQHYVFEKCGGDEDKLWKEFKLLGYDDRLQLQGCRQMALSIHSTSDFVLDSLPYDESAVEEAEELVILNQGEVKSFENGLIKLYKLRAGHSGVSLMVENLHHKSLVFEMDCSKSENVISHRGTLVHKEVIAPNERRVLHHLMPADPTVKSWAWSYSASFFWDV